MDRKSNGLCDYCDKRVRVTRKNHFFTTWRCAECGSPVKVVGDTSIRAVEKMRADAAAAAELAKRQAAYDASPHDATGYGRPVR